nr:MAG TPA: hypothetical protein [Caudoviricetes sp.]
MELHPNTNKKRGKINLTSFFLYFYKWVKNF